jgi:hypothetical protein
LPCTMVLRSFQQNWGKHVAKASRYSLASRGPPSLNELRRARARASRYRMQGETLYRVCPDGVARQVPPPGARLGIIKQAHETTGHFGVRRTTALIAAGNSEGCGCLGSSRGGDEVTSITYFAVRRNKSSAQVLKLPQPISMLRCAQHGGLRRL